VLALTLHHIVSDGWSLGVLLKELSAIYGARVEGRAQALAPLPVQYADYAAWQRGWMSAERMGAQLEYWKRVLQGAVAVLDLPLDRARPALETHRGGALSLELPGPLTASLRALSQRNSATLFMTLMAAFNVLLGRYARQSDLCVGYPVANRNRTEIEGLIGFFVNTLVLRTRLDLSADFAALLRQVRESVVAADANQDLPFERLIEELRPARDLGHSPLFQVMFSFHDALEGAASFSGVELQPLDIPGSYSKFDLTLSAWPSGEGLKARFEYNCDLFEEATIRRMAANYRVLLEAVIAQADRPIGELPLLTLEERRKLLLEWNDTAQEFARDQCIHELFEEQARNAPQAVAVVFEQERLTYAELNARANRLAHYLRQHGIGPEALVAIALERSAQMVVALLGVLKAGAAYVPLDPGYPQERLAYMLQDTGAPILITQQGLRERFAQCRAAIVLMDEHWEGIERHSPADPPRLARPQNLAYCIYTSGSTGKPKAVQITHYGLANLASWQRAGFMRFAQRGTAQIANPSFDALALELWPALIAGASVHLPPPELAQDVAKLLAWLTSRPISFSFVPTPLVALFAERIGATPASFFECVWTGGGELARPKHWPPGLRLVNDYGPTECTVAATSGAVQTAAQSAAKPHIGRPIANTQIYILDARLNPVPVGVVGEIYIGGAGLARGYLGRGATTAERFVPNPYSRQPGARMYRTGDLGRWLPEGNIECLGRNDFQVKIRGFRVEPGEIEAALLEHRGVREAAVLAREDTPAGRRLVAYVVGAARDELAPAQLRAHLQARLPEYMVPAAFVVLQALPLTPNGKLDRAALPAPERQALLPPEQYEPPEGEIEAALARIWDEVLHVGRVGRHDNFFDLGGHSLLATQVIARIRQALGVEVALRELFRQPSLRALAQAVASGGTAALPAIERADRSAPLPASPAQRRLWFLERLDGLGSAYHVSGALNLKGRLNRQALRATLDQIIARHEALRTIFAEHAGEPSQVVMPPGGFALQEIDLGGRPPAEAQAQLEHCLREEASASFDLRHGPLIRGRLVRLATQEHVLLVTMHHIVSDGWSVGVLLREVAALYEAHRHGHASPLPDLPIQYADYASWQRRWLAGELLKGQLDYWKRELAGAPALLELPTDRARPPLKSHAGASVELRLPAPLTAKLQAFAREHDATLFMVLLAGWAATLARLSGQEDIVIGSPVAGRQRVELEPLIGLFVNTLALRVRVQGTLSVAQLLERVKELTLAAYAQQDVPFEQVVEAIQPPRSLSHSPVFQVMFVLQNAPLGALELAELKLEPLEVPRAAAQFDLTLSLREAGGELAGGIEYASALFERETVERFAGYLQAALRGMVEDPKSRVDELALLGEAERARLVVELNRTQAPSLQERLIHELFEEQAERTPREAAVVFQDAALSYAALNAKANQLAHYLRALGVGPERRVAICIERSIEMLVGLLGILKAGGAYVPLDAADAAERLATVLEDAAPCVLLTQARLLDKLAACAAPVVCLDRDWRKISPHSTRNPRSVALPGNLAYVIYTSGSTGRPKGVQIAHRGLVHYLSWAAGAYPMALDAGAFVQLPLVFDATITPLFLPLLAGKAVHLLPELEHPGGFDFLKEKRGISLLKITPAHIDFIASSLGSAQPAASIALTVVGGEALSAVRARTWLERFPGTVIVNEYGPTETVVGCCVYRLDRPLEDRSDVPIGRPIANTQIYILDARLNPVPVGVVGEIYIGGEGLARGYLNCAGLSAEKFIPNPFGPAGSRMYRTGDLGRYRSDGNIDYLGRTDHQVKVRGFRIELGEVEAALCACANVREAVVVAGERPSGEKRLVAYVVARTQPAPTVSELRAQLQRRLPEYMVPTAYVSLERLPLTPNGKLDRKGLPAPEGAGLEQGKAYVAPHTPTEAALAGIWAEVLQLERVGIHDDFFALGGHSLLAMQVVARVRESLNVDLPLQALFKQSTVAGLAAMADAAISGGASDVADPAVDLAAEAALDPAIQPRHAANQPADVAAAAAVLLTGASGFLGAYLLYELLRSTRAQVYCLLRCDSEEEGGKRIQSNLANFLLWEESFAARIVPVPGDLSKPRLGLGGEEFDHLAGRIDAIYHSGAWVNFLHPYSRLKAANVSGTQEVIRLAARTRRKPLHFVSTASVFPPTRERAEALELDAPPDWRGLGNGYAQSKWVAEKLVMSAAQRGLPVRIYRPGMITGDSKTGICNTDDFIFSMIKGCVQLGLVPDTGAMVGMVPVDYVSQAIVRLSRQEGPLSRVFHVVNPRYVQLSELVGIVRSLGYRVQMTSYQAWRQALLRQAADSTANALYPFLPLFTEKLPEEREPSFDCRNTLEGLAGTGVACPDIGADLMRTYFSYFTRCRFLRERERFEHGQPVLGDQEAK
jgi:amino acid adenylation domain-containing protein/thioester reductase-like protein